MTDLPTRSRLNSHLDRPQEVKAGTGTAILDPHEQPLPEPAPAPMMSFWIRADLNRNGKLDAAAVGSGGTLWTLYDLSRAGDQRRVGQSTAHRDPRDVVPVDVNGDGVLDLLTANRAEGNVSIFLGHGSDDTTEYEFLSAIDTEDGPRALTVGDFNLDGRPDMASGNQYAKSVTILRNMSEFAGRVSP